MNKKAFIGIGVMGLAVALLSGIGIYNSSSSLKSEIKEARAEGSTTYTVSCRDVYDHGVGWGNGDVYFYYEYKEGSTKTAPAWPGTKMNQIRYYDGDAWRHNYITFTPEDEVAFFRFNGGNPDQVETKDIPFFTDRHEEQVYANRATPLTMFKCTIDYVENNATLTYEGITFEPWANPLILPSTAGNYYLGVDVEPIREWYAPEGETSILLNGHTVIPGDDSAHRLIYIREGSTLNIYDNSDIERTYRMDSLNNAYIDEEYNEEHAQQGYIVKGGCFAQAYASDNEGFENPGKGGTIYNGGTLNIYSGTILGGDNYQGGGGVYNAGIFTMYGGTLSRNKSREGCAIMNTGTTTIKEGAIIKNNRSSGVGTIVNRGGDLILDGPTITNNFASDFGAGVYLAAGNLTLKGKVNITGNKNSSESESNLYVGVTPSFNLETFQEEYIYNYLSIDGGKLSEGSNIGISMRMPGDFTTGLSKTEARANLPFFTSDDANYSVYRNVETNQLSLIEGTAPEDPAHEHNLTYTADGATITATCSADECDLQDNKATLTLEAPTDLVYSGSAKVATIKAGYDTTVFPNPQIKYYQGNTEVTQCVNVGTYTAKVTVEGATAVVEFSITKANPTVESVSDRDAVYGQTLSEIELPIGWSWNSPTDKVGNVGTRQHKATFTPTDTANYNTVEQNVNVIVAKANPEYTVPTGLTALVNKTLSTVTLPAGWTWDDPNQNVGSEVGDKVFKGTFTPEDTENYNIVEHVDITVKVSEHEHNWSYTANGATLTASCGASGCPVTSGLTLTLKAPAGDMHYDGSAKVATLQEGYSVEAFPNAQIKYFKDNTEVNECVNVGKYTAKVTFGNAVAMVEFEILGKSMVDPGASDVSIEVDDVVVPENVELRVEVRTDVAEKEVAADYAKIQAILESNEQISKVYDVKLIQTIGGVEKEIQPSDIQPGLKITVRMAIPEGMDMSNVRILHIHNVDDMEFVTDYRIEGNELVFEIDRLSQFAFVTKVNAAAAGLNGGIIALIIILSILALLGICFLLLFFVFAKFIIVVENNEEKVARAIKVGEVNSDEKKNFKLITFKFKKELRLEEEVFNKKADAEDYLNNKKK